MKRIKPSLLFITLSLLLIVAMVLGVTLGAVSLSFQQFWAVITMADTQSHYHSILFSIRLPRVLLAVFVGSILAMCGAAMQGLFRNPLADPSLIGVTAGASLGASLMIVLLGVGASVGLNTVSNTGLLGGLLTLPTIALGAFTGGVLAVLLVYRLAKRSAYADHHTSVGTMLLAGIGITALAGSLTSLLEFYASNELLRRMSLWRMGGLEGVGNMGLLLAASVCLFLIFYFHRFAQSLNALLLGESEARHLGVDVERLKRQLIIATAAGVGIAVALTGAIGFVGLVVPHIMRLLIGPNHRYLLPAAALGGAILLVVADLCARLLLAPTEIPVGIVTAFIGVPFFISLLQRRQYSGSHVS